ncbi:MAG: hypothetical protein JJT95_13075 [Pararhodobacter sp.]|nr:hypothetical protein [Pararhodobacter sp.]
MSSLIAAPSRGSALNSRRAIGKLAGVGVLRLFGKGGIPMNVATITALPQRYNCTVQD